MAVIYRPKHQRQINGFDLFGRYNCTAYAAAIAIDRATLGKRRVTGRDVRRASSEPIPSDESPGLNLNQTDAVAAKLGVQLTSRQGRFIDALAALAAGRGVVLQGDYDQMGAFSCQETFLGDHAEYLNNLNAAAVVIAGKSHKAGTAVLTYDPLCKAYRWVPIGTLKRYCEKHAIATGGKVRYAITRITPLIAKQIN